MHDNRKLSGDRNRSALEAHSLTQMVIASSRDMAAVVDLA